MHNEGLFIARLFLGASVAEVSDAHPRLGDVPRMRPSALSGLLAALLALASPPATASQTACTFEGGKAPQYYEVEFIGYSDVNPMIVFSSTTFGSGKRITLQPETYSLKRFSQKAAMVHLEFRNPGSRSLPPSFNLAGQRGKAHLKIGSATVDGSLKCD